MMFVIAYGSLDEGFKLYGPFSEIEAIAYSSKVGDPCTILEVFEALDREEVLP